MKTVTISALIVFVNKYAQVQLAAISNKDFQAKLRLARSLVGAYRAFIAKQTATAARTLMMLQKTFITTWNTKVNMSVVA